MHLPGWAINRPSTTRRLSASRATRSSTLNRLDSLLNYLDLAYGAPHSDIEPTSVRIPGSPKPNPIAMFDFWRKLWYEVID